MPTPPRHSPHPHPNGESKMGLQWVKSVHLAVPGCRESLSHQTVCNPMAGDRECATCCSLIEGWVQPVCVYRHPFRQFRGVRTRVGAGVWREVGTRSNG